MTSKVKIAFNDMFILPLPPEHKFPIKKYKLIPKVLLSEGTISEENIISPKPELREIVELTHSKEYVEKLLHNKLTEKELRKIGFPGSSFLIERELMITNGTRLGAEYALENGISFNVAGGTHHAFADHGEGFCLLNDVAVASNYLIHKRGIGKILVIDLDVHQGNGTAKIFEKEDRVFTFSMHGKDNFPLKKESSSLDIPLRRGTCDDEYLRILSNTLPKLLNDENQDFLFFIAGADVLGSDRWGHLNLTLDGVKERDKFVFTQAKKRNLPLMVSMGGGYSPDIDIIVEAHCNTFRAGFENYLTAT